MLSFVSNRCLDAGYIVVNRTGKVSGLTELCATGCVSLQGAFPIYQGLSQNLARDGRAACGLVVKNPPANAGDRDAVSIPELGDPLEEDTATYSSILAWRIPWTEEPGAYGP